MMMLWLFGIVGGIAYGSTGIHGAAATWPVDHPEQATLFVGASWSNGTVCTALSPNHEYAAVEWAYRNGELWWCEDGSCEWVSGGGYVVGVDDDGDMFGSNAAINCYGVLWTDDGQIRWDYPDWYRITARTHDAVTTTNRDAGRTQETIFRYDANCDGRVDFFDVDPFVANLFGWLDAPPCNTFWYGNDDIDPFVSELLR